MGFVCHPAVRYWIGYQDALKSYINAHIREWIRRGYKNTMILYDLPEDFPLPPWSQDPDFHDNHKGALLAKEPEWYRLNPEFQNVPPFVDYIWPV